MHLVRRQEVGPNNVWAFTTKLGRVYDPSIVTEETTELPQNILDQMRFLPDYEIVLQNCRAVGTDRRDDAVQFWAFLVARCSMIDDGADFTTAACLSATRFDDFTVECLQRLACDEIREVFDGFAIEEVSVSYSIANGNGTKAKELIISDGKA